MKKVGLIINPVAGMGGKVGLKGTDGPAIVDQAVRMGARPEAAAKALIALKGLLPIKDQIELITCPGPMGEEAALEAGFNPRLLDPLLLDTPSPLRGDGRGGGETPPLMPTLPAHTEDAAKALAALPVDLLLFAGGDGTARNIHNALAENTSLTVIGIPAGVKIHSAVYATTPRSAGELARQYLQEGSLPLRQAEVMDIDEDAFRDGRLSARLYGYLPVPCSGNLMQHLKVGGVATETSILESIAEQVVENMQDQITYIIGPGSTISPIMARIGLKNTLLGVDVVRNGKLLAADVGEKELLAMICGQEAKIIVTVIGGQGYIFGRGNQQISAEVIRQVGRDNIIVVATKEKILALEHGSLLVDSGDEEVNAMLRGYIRVITGYREELICKVQ